MNEVPSVLVRLLAGLMSVSACLAAGQQPSASGPFAGWATNGAAVFRLYVRGTQAVPGPPVSRVLPPATLPPEIRRALLMFEAAANVTVVTNFDRVFDHFVPASLNHLVWTNFIAHTNGRTMAIWSIRRRTPGWPALPEIVRWNPKSLVWGMKGMTALSPCWQGEGPPGWAPITALTRRHGYLRGHDMGPDRVGRSLAGNKVWFLTTQNKLVETTIVREVVRTGPISHRDYTIVLFSSDLPEEIEPMRAVHPNEVWTDPHCRLPFYPGAPTLLFQTEQGGNVSAGVPGFTVEIMKGGDSGSPNMVPLPGELVFWNGRTTSGVSPEMQADMDQLCRLEGIDPRKYQVQWVDLSAYPEY